MPKNLRKILSCFLIIFLVFLTPTNHKPASAAEYSMGVARTYVVNDKAAIDGDIVSISQEPNTMILSQTNYDQKVFGVIVMNPLMVYRTLKTNIPIVREGETLVNVTNFNGDITPGNFITTSEIAGKGQKATDATGAILGIALEGFKKEQGTEIEYNKKKYSTGPIKVALGIQTPAILRTRGGMFGTLEALSLTFLRNVQQNAASDKLIRYIIAGIVASLTIIINFQSFGKNISKGIESIGRNPLARVYIQSMIILNIILIAVTSIGGVILSLAIISF